MNDLKLEFLQSKLPMKRCKNNHRIFTSEKCLCNQSQEYQTRGFRYNAKFGVVKCFSCGFGSKDLATIKKAYVENMNLFSALFDVYDLPF